MNSFLKLVYTQDVSKFLDVEGTFKSLGRQEKLKLAFKKSALFFILALASVFIPVFHFVLVPVFLLISAIILFKAFNPMYQLKLSKRYPCVQCQKDMQLEYIVNEDQRIKCDHCHGRYIIQTTSGPQG